MAFKNYVYGVDFSGARKPGKKIWIATGAAEADQLRVLNVESAAEKFDTGPQRETVLSAFVEFIAGLGDALVGCDFPFSLPHVLLDEQDWETFVRGFGGRYRSADDHYERTHRVTARKEPKRYTDKVARTTWSPINWRIRWQTYHGIRDVLASLVAADRARVIPMQKSAPGKPSVIEVCPKSTLQRLGLPFQGYKGRTAQHREVREAILHRVVASGPLAALDGRLKEKVVANTGGDALDAVLAAVATFCAGRSPGGLHPDIPPDQLNEGWVFV